MGVGAFLSYRMIHNTETAPHPKKKSHHQEIKSYMLVRLWAGGWCFHTAGEDVNFYNYCKNQYGDSSRKESPLNPASLFVGVLPRVKTTYCTDPCIPMFIVGPCACQAGAAQLSYILNQTCSSGAVFGCSKK